MDTTLISVVIPHYNHTRALQKCLSSLWRQTFKNFEIIIVDDGSTNHEKSNLENLTQFHGSNHGTALKIIYSDHRGASYARNRGAGVAEGKCLLFCDADVIMRPDCLEIMLRALEVNPSAAYAYCSFKFGFKTFPLHTFNSEELKRLNYIHTTSLLRREWFPGFDENLTRFQDWDLWLEILERGGVGVWIPRVLFTVTPRRGGISSWLPSFMYEIPWHKFGLKIKRLESYRTAEEIIKNKHHLH